MPPQTDHASLHLHLLPDTYFLVQLGHDAPLPAPLLARLQRPGPFLSLTRTPDEVSVVGASIAGEDDAYAADWRCIKIAGPMDLGLTGIMADFTAPLKSAAIPVFALSTWNTDYVLVPKDKAEAAVRVLTDDGWKFVEP
ncbi:hypothetical protein BV25DRAFT_1828984 [Artomyces pyxidatus]|uniref:Uncharacterized protein n=1 Tax=Artomyces pyxidatus TaxID=48021 RepID=A0ACB8STC1_9AGAM|nr:hypothetical protein BV25DRAFT_1828984 [Artomyces pyxidatus]